MKHTLRRFVLWGSPLAVMTALLVVAAYWPRASGTQAGDGGVWTCSMHPQIRLDHFDRCPICGMDLTAVVSQARTGDEQHDHLQLSTHAQQMARVGTTRLERRTLFREIRTVGRIDFDETRRAQIASRVAGRVEQVFADFPGTLVKQGDHLLSIYSPELLSTQEEFLVASRRERELTGRPAGVPSLAASARRRLKLWGISEAQLDEILTGDKAQTNLIVYAPLGGTVVEKLVRAGQYVKEGDALFSIADLSHVWLVIQVYETDLMWVRFGQTVEVKLEADPSASFSGQIGFIEPVLNEQTRTVPVRVILKNDSGRLKPGMFAQAVLQVAIMPDGQPAPTGLEGKFACPMHPYIVSEETGTCPVCEMSLEKIPGRPMDVAGPPLILGVPADAVLTTGRRGIVYVDRGAGDYQSIEPHLGARAGEYYPVLHGLAEGDHVVTRGNFLIDSQFQISGKPSLLYPTGMGGGGAGAHQHGTSAGGHPEPVEESVEESLERQLARLGSDDRELARRQKICPVTGEPLGSMGVPLKIEVEGQSVFLCCAGCTSAVRKAPQEILKKLAAPAHDAKHDEHRH